MPDKRNEENRISNPLSAAAARYVEEMDWAIFALAPRTKVPRKGTRGHLDATKDLKVIERFWKESPHSNIGCATGTVSGVFVLDADDAESFKVFCAGREFPVTARQQTSPGRMQLFFKIPANRSMSGS